MSLGDDDDSPGPRMPDGAEVRFLGPDLALLSFPLASPRFPESLTQAEREVALLVFEGASTEEIARSRQVSAKTVANQLDAIFRKAGVASRAELVLSLRAPLARDER
jgi:DNA-binding CsgD family transcriptional regulator